MRRAFTLVEILAVVAIVGVLAAILFPVLARAKAAVKASSCLANLGQIARAEALYEADSNGHTVALHYFERFKKEDDYEQRFWYGLQVETPASHTVDVRKGLLSPYLKGDLVTRCPAASFDSLDTAVPPLAYGINWSLQRVVLTRGPRGALTNAFGVPAGEIESPADTVLFADSARLEGTGTEPGRVRVIPSPELDGPSSLSPKSSNVSGRHGGTANVVWCDGHAKGMRVSFLFDEGRGAQDRAEDLGDLVAPSHPYDGCAKKTASGECAEDFYFLLTKPTP